MRPRIYAPHALCESAEITLEKNASAHLCRVLRMQPGDRLIAFNGDGYDYPAKIVSVGKSVTIQVTGRQINRSESGLQLTLAQGISRGDRMDFTLQKSVELGVTAIQPLITQKSTVRLDAERAEKKLRHWRSVIHSACEQCGRSLVPTIAPPTTLTQWLLDSADEFRIVLDPGATDSLAALSVQSACTIIVGPESGFSGEELEQLRASNVHPASIGPRVLRTETAAAAAIAILQSRHGDMC